MSPQRFQEPASVASAQAIGRVWHELGRVLRERRIERRWSVQYLATRAGVSRSVAYDIEAGVPTSLDAVVRVATALGRHLEIALLDPRRRTDRPPRQADIVHASMGELEAAHLRRLGLAVGLDEPYQHYQFAGRADVVSWDLDARAMLQIENRTRFPDFQQMAGSYNAKRAYLGAALAQRLGIGSWRSETHVIAALWSAEVLRALRRHPESFRALCPDPPDAFAAWWSGTPPARSGTGTTSTLVVLDPLAEGRQRQWIGLDDAPDTRPRHRGYADVAVKLPRQE